MNDAPITCDLQDEAATIMLAQRLAQTQPGPAMVHLEGDLGAGKSTLARAFLRALGVTGAIPSPTYSVLERYVTAKGDALHLDLYRIGDAGELEFLGLDDLDPWLWLVEWPQRAGAGLPPVDLHLHLEITGEGRCISMRAGSATGQTWLQNLNQSPNLAQKTGNSL